MAPARMLSSPHARGIHYRDPLPARQSRQLFLPRLFVNARPIAEAVFARADLRRSGHDLCGKRGCVLGVRELHAGSVGSCVSERPHGSIPSRYDIPMNDGDYKCPKCGSTDLVSIRNKAIDGELLECQSCKRMYQVVYEAETTPRLLAA